MKKRTSILLSAAAAAAIFLAAGPAPAQISGKLVNPNVLLVVDSSGSMDWLQDHPEDATEAWIEAQEQCEWANDPASSDPKRTSWQQLLDVMLGEIPSSQFHCFMETPEVRPALKSDTIVSSDVNTFAEEYFENHHNHYRSVYCADSDWNETFGQCVGASIGADYTTMNNGHVCKLTVGSDQNYFPATATAPELCDNYHDKAMSRPTNGILERYASLVRFGLMTYDNRPMPADLTEDPSATDEEKHEGLWNYGQTRQWDCKQWYYNSDGAGCTWNAGARAANANAIGRMVPISDDLEQAKEQISQVFDSTEPLNCSPLGALIDDVGYYFARTPNLRPAEDGAGSDIYFKCRPKVVILISDGQPTKDFEFPQNYCDTGSTTTRPFAPTAPEVLGTSLTTYADDPDDPPYSCPWNSSRTEVEELANLIPDIDEADPVLLVVIGFNAGDRGEVDCAGTHTWEAVDLNNDTIPDGYECVPPDDRCVQVGAPTDETDCLAGQHDGTSGKEDAFLTPRQFLNQLALTGWPATPEYDAYLQAPWRSSDLTFCDDDDDNCGGEDGDPAPWDDDGAVFVDSAEELSAILDLILSQITATVATRTDVVTTDQVMDRTGGYTSDLSLSDGTAQYEFNTGFEVRGGKPWRGYLYRQGYSCVEDGVGGQATGTPVEYHELLKNQTTRNLYTIKWDDLDDISYVNVDTIKDGDGSIVKTFDTSNLDDEDVGGPSSGGTMAIGTEIVDQVAKYLKGEEGDRVDYPLGDIYNSTPSILASPTERITESSYLEYITGNLDGSTSTASGPSASTPTRQQRPPYLFVGTNDSILHSFKVAGVDETSTDAEVWGFVPYTLLEGVSKQFPISWEYVTNPVTGVNDSYTVTPVSEDPGIYQHYFGVDGSPVTADVRLWTDPNATDVDPWRAVVLGSFGKGAAGYYCLDITVPYEKPKFRWEISERTASLGTSSGGLNLAGNNASSVFYNGGDFGIGVPLGKPALAYVHINEKIPGGSSTKVPHQEAVAILPGGLKNDENGGPDDSTGVYIVRVADGEVLRFLDPSDTDDICGTGDAYAAQLVGTPAVPVGSRSANVADEAFMGDDRGRLWRVSFEDENPDDWCLQMYFDTLLTYHYPYKDCVSNSNPADLAHGSNECCVAKDADPANECPAVEQEAFASDGEWGVDACTGLACTDPDYPFPRIPITKAPTIVQDEERNNIIIFGTGQLDALETLNHNRIFSLTEKITYSIGDGTTSSSSEREPPDINWWIGEEPLTPTMESMTPSAFSGQITHMNDNTFISFDASDLDLPIAMGNFFNMGEKLLGSPIVFDGVAYFTTYIPAVPESGVLDGCESGGAKLWGVKFDSPDNGLYTAWDVSDFEQLTWTDPDSGTTYTEPFKSYENMLLSGAKVVRRPSCSGEATFQLVAQRVMTAAEQAAAPSLAGGPQQFTTEALNIRPQSLGFTTVLFNSWSLVFN